MNVLDLMIACKPISMLSSDIIDVDNISVLQQVLVLNAAAVGWGSNSTVIELLMVDGDPVTYRRKFVHSVKRKYSYVSRFYSL